MRVNNKDVLNILKTAKKYGVSSNRLLITFHRCGGTSAVMELTDYKNKKVYKSDIACEWEAEEKETYYTDAKYVPKSEEGVLKVEDNIVELINGPTNMVCTTAQVEKPMSFIFYDEAAFVDTNLIKEDIKDVVEQAPKGTYVSVCPKHVAVSPNIKYGAFIKRNVASWNFANDTFVISKEGMTFALDNPGAPIAVHWTNGDQSGVEVQGRDDYFEEELLYNSQSPHGPFGLYQYWKVGETVESVLNSWDDDKTPTFTVPKEVLTLLSKKPKNKLEIHFTGDKGAKLIHYKVGEYAGDFVIDVPLAHNLKMLLDQKLAYPYFKALKKYGGYVAYDASNWQCKFKYTDSLEAMLLGLKVTYGGR